MYLADKSMMLLPRLAGNAQRCILHLKIPMEPLLLIVGKNNLIVLKYHVEIDFSGYIPFSSFSDVGELR